MSYEFQEAHRNYEDMQTLSKKIQQGINKVEKAKMAASFREAYMVRLVKHQTEISNTTRDLEKYIKRLTLAHLNAQKERVNRYVSQARFSMAQIYDQAARTSGQWPFKVCVVRCRTHLNPLITWAIGGIKNQVKNIVDSSTQLL